jgi:hypothetical protein
MPASAGRVRMPHNNRMSTSATLKTHAIWQTAIGHDPYANDGEKKDGVTEAEREKAKSVMEMARSQNLTDGAERSGFTAQMYRGLKQGKKRKADEANRADEGVDPQLQHLLADPSSSSEEEFVEVVAESKKEVKRKKSSGSKRKKPKRSRRHSSSTDSDLNSFDESSDADREARKRRKDRKKKKHKRRSRDYSSSHSDHSDAESRGRKRERKDRKGRKDKG